LPLPQEKSDLFSTSGSCSICHANLSTEEGLDASPDASWRSSMMANAARDPYWQASVSAEILANPALQDIIEDRCATCHMPMAHITALEGGDDVRIVGEGGVLDPSHALHTFAMEGVSCTLCHQIRADGLGDVTSYSGGFTIDTLLRSPDRLIFGPYTIDDEQADLMQSGSGFRPEQGLHLTQSTFCATCHTLYTPFVDATGQIAGDFPQQVPYFEWFTVITAKRDPARIATCSKRKAGSRSQTRARFSEVPSLYTPSSAETYICSKC
jgi:cytochrome c peroxidase